MHIRRCEITIPGCLQEEPCIPHTPTGCPWKPSKTLEILVFLHVPSKGGPYSFRQNLIVSPKTFKILVKMNVFIVRSLPTATQRRSRPRHAWAACGLRVKCVTWQSLKNHRETLCFQCAPRHSCVNTILYCGHR